jgi:predicted secreted hydrolase
VTVAGPPLEAEAPAAHAPGEAAAAHAPGDAPAPHAPGDAPTARAPGDAPTARAARGAVPALFPDRTRRRRIVSAAAATAALVTPWPRAASALPRLPAGALDPFDWAPVRPEPPMRFPDDFGAHPDHRTEWWYVTGWLRRPGAADAGFQLTFFRSRSAHPAANPSRFAPTQLVLAHAALALPERGRLLHAERSARAGAGLAEAAPGDTRVRLGTGTDAWTLVRDPTTDRYRTRIVAREFAFELGLDPRAPPLLQGDAGFSRKGPRPEQASRYYSRPQLAVDGRVTVAGREVAVDGRAWFDHEWSSEILDEGALGWDWTGINLDDGGALMAFRLRGRDGAETWRDATLREGAEGPVRTHLAPAFEPLRHWTSPRSGARWPVSMRLRVEGRDLELRPLFDDQELDARGSTGTTYWEGAVTAFEAGRRVGRGYLELTGYAGALRL